jgi:hypothetical protein
LDLLAGKVCEDCFTSCNGVERDMFPNPGICPDGMGTPTPIYIHAVAMLFNDELSTFFGLLGDSFDYRLSHYVLLSPRSGIFSQIQEPKADMEGIAFLDYVSHVEEGIEMSMNGALREFGARREFKYACPI